MGIGAELERALEAGVLGKTGVSLITLLLLRL